VLLWIEIASYFFNGVMVWTLLFLRFDLWEETGTWSLATSMLDS